MKRVKITNHVKNENFGADFEDPTEWITQEVENNSWGKPDRWLPDSALNPLSDEEKAKATETRVLNDGLGNGWTEYFFPAEYTIEITDITAEVEQEKVNAEALKYLADTDWLMIRELEIGKPMPEEIKLKRQEARNKVVK